MRSDTVLTFLKTEHSARAQNEFLSEDNHRVDSGIPTDSPSPDKQIAGRWS